MSKQLTISSTLAVLSMALFALASTTLGIGPDTAAAADAANLPLVGFEATR